MKEKRKREAIEVVERLPHVLVEDILQRLEIKPIIRFTRVSKQWNSTIKSRYFASRHLARVKSPNPDILLGGELVHESKPYPCLRTLGSHSGSLRDVNYIPKPRGRSLVVTGSCDGLVCIYDFKKVLYVFNPATRWCRFLPLAKIQKINWLRESLNCNSARAFLGFGKDTLTSNYKMVWLYNSFENLDGQTTCEVFDFATNTWRYVIGSRHRICDHDFKSHPVYSDGSLYWLTPQLDNKETKMICFDLHAEVFQRMEIPINYVWPHRIIMCSLNNRLCVSAMKINGIQDIWSLKSDKVWEKTHSLDLSYTTFGEYSGVPLSLVAIFDKTRMLILWQSLDKEVLLLVEDTETYFIIPMVCIPKYLDQAISFIPSLMTI
ncbi:F-box protein At1g11270-like [Brassica rapa]|uniref:F-box protein At1g11270-like n=1 Tax=Brassica campestris TaxID=3711 RepID=UPI00142D26EB|nr:F-box protein At1g11270-like [Brassica rapa]